MPVFIFPQPGGGNPILSFIIGIAVLAVAVGLFIFFLPVFLGVVAAIVILGLLLYGWSWLKVKLYGESEEVKNFREAMERAEAQARRCWQSGGGFEEEVSITRIESGASKGAQGRRKMEDVEDIEENK